MVSKTASPGFTRTFKWGITKSVDQTQINTSSSATFNYTVSVTHDGGTDSAWQVTGSIRLSNPASTDITGVTVTDAVDNGGSCTVDSSFSGTVPAGSHVEVPYTCTYGSAPSSSAGTNTATATWNNGGNNAAGTAAFDFSNATPTIVDGSVTISDTLGGTLGSVSYTDLSPKTFTYPKTFTDPAGTCTSHPNTATFTTNTTSSTGSSSQQIRVCAGADLTVSKTATPSFTYGITKTANQTSPLDTSNPNQTLTYTITVTESGWKVSGNISVTNPNNWESVSVGLNDALSGFDCTYNSSVTVGPSSTATVPYSCTPTGGGVPSASGTNSVTATWSGAYTPDTSVPASAGFTFASLTVTDTFNGLAPKTLGTITTPAASTTYPDSYSVTAPASTCNLPEHSVSH